MNIETEFNQKVVQLREVYRQRGKSALIITQQNNVSWLLRGRTFVNTASTRSLIDLVITDDTSIGHLAGALDKPAWILLARAPD